MKKNSTENIISLCEGNVISISSIERDRIVPLFCPLCEFPLKTSDDSIAYDHCGVCVKCQNRWENTKEVDLNQKKYPDKSSELWKEYIEVRAFQAKPIFKFN